VRVILSAAAVGVGLLLASCGGPATPTSITPVTAGPVFQPVTKATACQARYLSASELGAGGAGSSLVVAVELENLGRPCRMSNDVQQASLLAGKGRLNARFLGTTPGAPVAAVRLPPVGLPKGGIVEENLEWQNWCRSAPGPLSVSITLFDSGTLVANPRTIPTDTLVPGTGQLAVPACENTSSPSTLTAGVLETPEPQQNSFAGNASPPCTTPGLLASYVYNQGSGQMLNYYGVIVNTQTAVCFFVEPIQVLVTASSGAIVGQYSFPRGSPASETGPRNGVPVGVGQALSFVMNVGEPGISCPAGASPLDISFVLSDGAMVPLSAPQKPIEGSAACLPDVIQINQLAPSALG